MKSNSLNIVLIAIGCIVSSACIFWVFGDITIENKIQTPVIALDTIKIVQIDTMKNKIPYTIKRDTVLSMRNKIVDYIWEKKVELNFLNIVKYLIILFVLIISGLSIYYLLTKTKIEKEYLKDQEDQNNKTLWINSRNKSINLKEEESSKAHDNKELNDNLIVGEEINNINRKYIKDTLKDLDFSILKYDCLGFVALIITILSILTLGVFVAKLFQGTIDDAIRFGKDVSSIASIVIILRTSLLGSFIISFIIYSYKFTNSCFDQATRFHKRKHATLFLLQILNDYGRNAFQNDNEGRIMHAFKEWNVSVESAFTDTKFNYKMMKEISSILKRNEDNKSDK